MSTSRRPLRRSTAASLALATGAASSVLGLAAAPAALADSAAADAVVSGITDADARAGAVAAIVLSSDGRPTFVEVVAPTAAQAVRLATAVPGSDGVAVDTPISAQAVRDPHRPLQWSLDTLKVDSLPPAVNRASHLVAVVDSGVRATHEDFAAGQVRCDLGADFTPEGLGACRDPNGHGTHVAGIVGAVTGNGKGVASIAPGTTILPVRVLDSTGSGGSLAVARGIVHAADKGAGVINLSLGGPGGSSALDTAVAYATDKGAVVVVSAGNNRREGNEVNYPAASPGALSVASVDRGGSSSSFSYSGPSVDIAAPGGNIASTWGTGDSAYASSSGTSMAAPAVSAVASLYRAAHPSATPAQVQAALIATAKDIEASGRDDNTGAGLVDPLTLLSSGASPTQPAPTQPAPTQPAPTQPAPTQPAPSATQPSAPTAPAPTAPAPTAPAPTAPAPTAPAPTSPAPAQQPPAPAPGSTAPPAGQPAVAQPRKAPVATAPAKAPAPRVRVVTARVARRQAVALVLADYRPASTVTVLERYPVTTRVRVRVDGRTVTRTRTTTRTVALGTFRVAANGSLTARVLPVRSVRAGTLVVRGFDRAGKLVQRTAAIRVG